MKKQFVLGQEVVIKGRYVINPVSPAEVDVVEARIKETGEPEASEKYSVEKFECDKSGIIAGVRSIVGGRIHYLDHNGQVVTKTTRQPAYLVATDMRGLCYVPVDMVTDRHGLKDEIEELKRENYELKFDLHLATDCISHLEEKLEEYTDLFDDDLDDELDELEDELVNV
ncbi:hypothetical protein ACA29_17120 [Lederbergia galactosidilytica]|uniref:Uncharacterized protein n=1 Tax=Lederbergia galactosidilytica TaxID=217031 RepID=A0A0Q9XTM0_9BACI|nr:hypothetical protein ACA29_17120 [Lederbergia galactosidilytica]